MKLFLSVYKTCFSLGSSFLLFLEKPDNSLCYRILEKQSLGMTRKVEGKRFREEGNSNKTVSRVRSGKSNADAKDKP